MLGRPEVFPVAAVGGGEEEVLDEDGHEEPLRRVSVLGEGWGFGLGRLTIMIFLRTTDL